MYIARHMEQVSNQINTQYPVLLVTGPRQVGKTTMLEHLAQKEGRGRETITLDDLTVRELAKTDPKMFFQLHRPPLLIDEVQYSPELFPYIKMMVDERRQPGDFWLTGSQLFSMMEGVQESLQAGWRCCSSPRCPTANLSRTAAQLPSGWICPP